MADGLREFSSAHDDATTFLYSSYSIFSRVLDRPEDYGWNSAQTQCRAGKMWVDHLHPTTAMHKIVASDFVEFMGQQKPFVAGGEEGA